LNLEISKFKSSASYILIYNYFNKQEEFDESHFTAFCKKNKLKNAGILINHLLNKLLQILLQYRITINTDKIEIEIKKLYDEASIYKELGFFEESAKKYKKALQLAIKNEKYLLVPEPLFELGQAAIVLKDTSILKNINENWNKTTLLDQMKWATNRIEDRFLNRIVFAELLILNLINLPVEEHKNRLKELLKYKPEKYNSKDFPDIINYYNVKISQAYAANKAKNYIKLIKEMIAVLPDFFKFDAPGSLQIFSARLFGLYQKQFFVEKKHFKHQFMNFNNHILNLAKQHQINFSNQLKKINEVRQSDLIQMGLFFENNLNSGMIKKHLPPDEKIDFLIGQNTYQKMY